MPSANTATALQPQDCNPRGSTIVGHRSRKRAGVTTFWCSFFDASVAFFVESGIVLGNFWLPGAPWGSLWAPWGAPGAPLGIQRRKSNEKHGS